MIRAIFDTISMMACGDDVFLNHALKIMTPEEIYSMMWFKGREDLSQKLARIRDTLKGKENMRRIAAALQQVAPLVTLPPPITMTSGYIYRSRNHDDRFSGLPTQISQLSARNHIDITRYGRANLPSQSVFYASPSPETAASETVRWHSDGYDPLIRDNWDEYLKNLRAQGKSEEYLSILEQKKDYFFQRKITVSQWRIKEPLNLIPFIDKSKVTDPELLMYLQAISEKPHSMPAIQWEYIQALTSFFANEFARVDFSKEDDYVLTALYADFMCFGTDRKAEDGKSIVDGIMYLSIASGMVGLNYALRIESLNKIECVSAVDYLAINKDRMGSNLNTNYLPTLLPIKKSQKIEGNDII